MEFSFGFADIVYYLVGWMLVLTAAGKETTYSYFLFDEKSFFMTLNSSSKWKSVEKLVAAFLNHGIYCWDIEYSWDWQRW